MEDKNDSQKIIVAKHFDSYASTWHDRLQQHGYAMRFEIIKRMVEGMVPRDVVDVGCGTGDYARLFDPGKVHYVGLDLSPQMIEQCKVLHPEYEFKVGDAERLEFDDESTDLTLDIAVLEYYKDPNPHMAELSRITRLGGTVISAVPNRDNWSRGWISAYNNMSQSPAISTIKRILGRTPPPTAPELPKDERIFHKRYSHADMEKLGSQVGLKLVEYAYASVLLWPYPFSWLQNLGLSISRKIGGDPCWKWITRRTATILICRFEKIDYGNSA